MSDLTNGKTLPNSSDKADFYELITDATITAGVVDATALASNAVTTAKILDDNITTAKILDANVTLAKLGTDVVNSGVYTANGVKFPAIAVPSADVNTLDDYEEGTWTPGISFGGGVTGIAFTASTGYYTKIGNSVTCTGFVNMSSKGSDTGAAEITGLPFTVGQYSAVSFQHRNVTFADQFLGAGKSGDSVIQLREITNAGVRTDIDNANFTDTTNFIFSITYRV